MKINNKNTAKTVFRAVLLLVFTVFAACDLLNEPEPQEQQPQPVSVSFDILTAYSAGENAPTTALLLRFNKDIDGLTADDIALDSGNTGAQKGVLTRGDTGRYALTVTGISSDGTVSLTVSKDRYTISPSRKSVPVFSEVVRTMTPTGLKADAHLKYRQNGPEAIDVTLSWDAVDGAVYNVYRAATLPHDIFINESSTTPIGVEYVAGNYTKVASGLTATSYTDTAVDEGGYVVKNFGKVTTFNGWNYGYSHYDQAIDKFKYSYRVDASVPGMITGETSEVVEIVPPERTKTFYFIVESVEYGKRGMGEDTHFTHTLGLSAVYDKHGAAIDAGKPLRITKTLDSETDREFYVTGVGSKIITSELHGYGDSGVVNIASVDNVLKEKLPLAEMPVKRSGTTVTEAYTPYFGWFFQGDVANFTIGAMDGSYRMPIYSDRIQDIYIAREMHKYVHPSTYPDYYQNWYLSFINPRQPGQTGYIDLTAGDIVRYEDVGYDGDGDGKPEGRFIDVDRDTIYKWATGNMAASGDADNPNYYKTIALPSGPQTAALALEQLKYTDNTNTTYLPMVPYDRLWGREYYYYIQISQTGEIGGMTYIDGIDDGRSLATIQDNVPENMYWYPPFAPAAPMPERSP